MPKIVSKKGHRDVEGRRIKYKTESSFGNWEIKHKATATDEQTGISAEGKRTKSRTATVDDAIENLKRKLKEASKLMYIPVICPIVVYMPQMLFRPTSSCNCS